MSENQGNNPEKKEENKATDDVVDQNVVTLQDEEIDVDALLAEIDDEINDSNESDSDDKKYVTQDQLEGALGKFADRIVQGMAGGSDKSQSSSTDDKDILKLFDNLEQNINSKLESITQKTAEGVEAEKTERIKTLFEEKAKSKYPDFEVDTLRLKYDKGRGLSTEDSLSSQLSKHKQMIIKTHNRIQQGEIQIQSSSTDSSRENVLSKGLPSEIQGFEPLTINQVNDKFRGKAAEREEYFKKKQIYDRHMADQKKRS